MIYMMLFIFSVIAALGTGVLAGWSDFRGLTIPNIYHVVIVGSFALAAFAVYMAGSFVMGRFMPHIVVALVVFVITFWMYWFRVFGGADAKLLSAYSLWVGIKGIVPLLFYMAIAGSLLAAFALYVGAKKPFKAPRKGGWIARLQAGDKRIPYGIPIAVGAVAAFYRLGFLSPGVVAAFAEVAQNGGG